MHVLFIAVVIFCPFLTNGEFALHDIKKSCQPGKAISQIYWTEERKNFKEFMITCSNITDSCNETCQWTTECSIKRHGEGSYLRGINAMYDNLKDAQSLLFLCCNASKSPFRGCRGKLEKADGQKHSQESVSFRQVKSNYPSDDAAEIYLEECIHERSNVTGCAFHKMETDEKMDPRLYGLAGLAGLSGLSGIALIKKKKCDCCFSDPLNQGDACADDCTPCASTLVCFGGFCSA